MVIFSLVEFGISLIPATKAIPIKESSRYLHRVFQARKREVVGSLFWFILQIPFNLT